MFYPLSHRLYTSVVSWPYWRYCWYLWALLLPIRPVLGAAFALPVLDLLLALTVAWRTSPLPWWKRYQTIRSTGIKRTVAKISMYMAGVLLAFITETWLTGSAVPCIHVVAGLVGLTELRSCLEHLDDLNGNKLYAKVLNALAPGTLSEATEDVEVIVPPAGEDK